MVPFQLHTPTTVDEALELLDRYGEDARPIAGGTALVLLMEQRLVRPEHLISLSRIPELTRIEATPEALTIGALVTHRALEQNADVKERWPLLLKTYRQVATVRIRNVATVGGGLAHADPNQDPPAAFIVLEARVCLASKRGTREVPVEDFLTGYYETSLEPGEILTHVIVPRPQWPLRTIYIKFLPRTADDYATVGVAAAISTEYELCHDARIVLNAAGPAPVHAREAETMLRGHRLTPELIRAAAATVTGIVDPTADHRGSANYKRRMAEVFTRRAVEQAVALNPD